MHNTIQFTIIIPVYNMAEWLGDTITLLKKQSYRKFRCLIGDDQSTDHSAEIIKQAIDGDDRFTLITHKHKKYSLGNICSLIELAGCDDEDVIILIDGDDRLAHEHVLQTVAETYSRNNCWLTYGSYSTNGPGVPDPICTPYPENVIKNNRFREVKWRASHLKTFKYKLWRHVEPSALTISAEELRQAKRQALLSGRWRSWIQWRKIRLNDLLDETGRFTRRCSDKAITSPMLEMAGDKAVFIPEILYYYRAYEKDLLFATAKNKQKWYQRLTRFIIKYKPVYHKRSQL